MSLYTFDHLSGILYWFTYATYFIGAFSFGLIMMIKGISIANYILTNINLLNRFQYRVAVTYGLLILLITLVDFSIMLKAVVKNIIISWGKDKFFNEEFIYWSVRSATVAYGEWITFGSFIYGIMYFLMHLKHMNVLDQMTQSKIYSYSLFYKALNMFESDHENFDNLLCLLPAIWLVHMLFATSVFIYLVKFAYTIPIMSLYTKELISWPLIFILISFSRAKVSKKISELQLLVALDDSTNGCQGEAMIKTLNKISRCNVTAGHLINMDKGLFLPFVGSVCTYTFLFMEKFRF